MKVFEESVENVGAASESELRAKLAEANQVRDAATLVARRITREIADRAARAAIEEQVSRLSPAARESLKSAL